MRDDLQELLTLDLQAVDLPKGLTGLVVVLIAAVFVGIFGTIGMVLGLAALFVLMADSPGPTRDRAIGILVMTLAGSLIALVGIWAGREHVWIASLLTFVVVLVATIGAGYGTSMATRGLLLSIWAVVALSLSGEQETALQLALAFAAGGVVAFIIIFFRARALGDAPIEAELEAQAEQVSRTLKQIVRSPLGLFALLRATTAGLAMALGATLFPDHAIWAALTVLLVMRAKATDTVGVGILRTLGTLLGVIAAEVVLIAAGGEDSFVIIGLLASAFAMFALQKVNYAVFVAFLTAVLVFSQELAAPTTGGSTATVRLLATVLGASLSLIAIGIGQRLVRRHSPVSPTR
jgi:hypothetical protein